jgi:hypothetical protein
VPLGCPPPLTVTTVNSIEPLKAKSKSPERMQGKTDTKHSHGPCEETFPAGTALVVTLPPLIVLIEALEGVNVWWEAH